MSLATRCTACGTVFRVVQDQLKVSEGWVRCGRCADVFNALEGLFDLERDSPPEGTLASTASDAGSAAIESPPATASPASEVAWEPAPAASPPDEPSLGDKIDAQLMASREPRHDWTRATRISERDRLEFPDAQFDPDMLAEEPIELRSAEAETAAPAQTALVAEPEPAAPGFVQYAQQRERRQSPKTRALQASVAIALMAGLCVQAAHHFRDTIAAHWPVVDAGLNAWCRLASCTIEAPRRIEDVAVESTALARAPAPDAFRLSVVLRNRGAALVALPSVDLSLTDASGQLLARRILAPRDFLSAPASIRAGAESALQLILAVDSVRVAGYTVEVFYP